MNHYKESMKLMEAKYTQALDYIFKSNQSSPYKNKSAQVVFPLMQIPNTNI